MKRIRITGTLMISAALALASVGAQAASNDLSADVVMFVDGTAEGTVVMTGKLDLGDTRLKPLQRGVEDVLRNEAAGFRVRVIIAPAGELDLVDPIDLLDPRNLPDCDCLLVGDLGPFQEGPGSLPERIYVTGSPETSSVSLSSWLLDGSDGQTNG